MYILKYLDFKAFFSLNQPSKYIILRLEATFIEKYFRAVQFSGLRFPHLLLTKLGTLSFSSSLYCTIT